MSTHTSLTSPQGDSRVSKPPLITFNTNDVVISIQLVYILAVVIWVIFIVYFHLYRTNPLGIMILCIPLLAFLLGYINTCLVDRAAEREALSLSYLTVGLLVLFPIIAWFKEDDGEWRKDEAITLLVISVMLILTSSLDFCVDNKWISLVRHIKSIAQIIAVTLIVFALYLYFSS